MFYCFSIVKLHKYVQKVNLFYGFLYKITKNRLTNASNGLIIRISQKAKGEIDMKKFVSMTNTFSADAMNTSAAFSCANRVNLVAMAKNAIALFVLSAIRIINIIRIALIGTSEYCSNLQTA